eukprot:SAG22_NODE_3156_length_1898_cov_1.675375_1_plen_519_part_00
MPHFTPLGRADAQLTIEMLKSTIDQLATENKTLQRQLDYAYYEYEDELVAEEVAEDVDFLMDFPEAASAGIPPLTGGGPPSHIPPLPETPGPSPAPEPAPEQAEPAPAEPAPAAEPAPEPAPAASEPAPEEGNGGAASHPPTGAGTDPSNDNRGQDESIHTVVGGAYNGGGGDDGGPGPSPVSSRYTPGATSDGHPGDSMGGNDPTIDGEHYSVLDWIMVRVLQLPHEEQRALLERLRGLGHDVPGMGGVMDPPGMGMAEDGDRMPHGPASRQGLDFGGTEFYGGGHGHGYGSRATAGAAVGGGGPDDSLGSNDWEAVFRSHRRAVAARWRDVGGYGYGGGYAGGSDADRLGPTYFDGWRSTNPYLRPPRPPPPYVFGAYMARRGPLEPQGSWLDYDYADEEPTYVRRSYGPPAAAPFWGGGGLAEMMAMADLRRFSNWEQRCARDGGGGDRPADDGNGGGAGSGAGSGAEQDAPRPQAGLSSDADGTLYEHHPQHSDLALLSIGRALIARNCLFDQI